MPLRLLKNRALSAGDTATAELIPDMSFVMRAYGVVKDMKSMAKLRLIVKPMFRKRLTKAEPIPLRCIGNAPMTLRRFGARKSPVPTPRIIMYTLSTA